jgi:hypothetical protein
MGISLWSANAGVSGLFAAITGVYEEKAPSNIMPLPISATKTERPFKWMPGDPGLGWLSR